MVDPIDRGSLSGFATDSYDVMHDQWRLIVERYHRRGSRPAWVVAESEHVAVELFGMLQSQFATSPDAGYAKPGPALNATPFTYSLCCLVGNIDPVDARRVIRTWSNAFTRRQFTSPVIFDLSLRDALVFIRIDPAAAAVEVAAAAVLFRLEIPGAFMSATLLERPMAARADARHCPAARLRPGSPRRQRRDRCAWRRPARCAGGDGGESPRGYWPRRPALPPGRARA